LVLAFFSLAYYWIFIPESPKWQYTWKIFDKARKTLVSVAKFNSNPDRTVRRLENSKFDIEVLEEKQNQMMADDESITVKEDVMEIKSQISLRLSLISKKQYAWNVVILSIMWTASSFSFYLLMFMNKYYEGSLYVNYYLDGVAGILGSVLSSAVYGPIKMRWSFIVSISITLIGAICLLIF
jgi:hypothetical protein